MKSLSRLNKRAWKSIKGMHLVDRCLIVFMIILLLQSAYTLFFQNGLSQESSSIDIIVRTACASIFGYFLSANFIREGSHDADNGTVTTQKEVPQALPQPSEGAQGVDIALSSEQPELQAENAVAVLSAEAPAPMLEAPTENAVAVLSTEAPAPTLEAPTENAVANFSAEAPAPTLEAPTAPKADYNHPQIIAATAIGLFCLLILIFLRNISMWLPYTEIPDSVAATVGQFRDFISGCVGFLIGTPTHKNKAG